MDRKKRYVSDVLLSVGVYEASSPVGSRPAWRESPTRKQCLHAVK